MSNDDMILLGISPSCCVCWFNSHDGDSTGIVQFLAEEDDSGEFAFRRDNVLKLCHESLWVKGEVLNMSSDSLVVGASVGFNLGEIPAGSHVGAVSARIVAVGDEIAWTVPCPVGEPLVAPVHSRDLVLVHKIELSCEHFGHETADLEPLHLVLLPPEVFFLWSEFN